MHRSDDLLENYNFDLPQELIAQRPLENRSDSKLLVYKISSDEVSVDSFKNIGKHLPESSSLIFNQSKVYKARLLGKKSSGAKVELLLLNSVEDDQGRVECLIKSSGKKKQGDLFLFDQDVQAQLTEILENGTFRVKFNRSLSDFLCKIGLIPIPPYIRGGNSDQKDEENYQTVYAKDEGSIAAPTAGLHFERGLIENLKSSGHELIHTCLHVGIGTFSPVKSKIITDHKMHSERYFFAPEDIQKLKSSRDRIAVGTTSLRALESRFDGNQFSIEAFKEYETNIFLHPGKEIKSVSGIVTNFHLPKSSLLMLVSALIGREKLLELYELAIEKRFRFFSYGDAMLVLK